ncbi:hypothetical protein DFH28DRAFT_966383 [Melampsora americana]|nr:hypothetical protein DFH28DRAFT_966383 [Melampsora americana]
MIFDSLIKTFWYPEEIVVCRRPSYAILIRLVPLWIQCALLHSQFSSSVFLGWIRLLLTPLNFSLAITISIDYCFLPFTKNGLLNMIMGIWSFHLATKSLEWGITEGHWAGKYCNRPTSKSSTTSMPSGSIESTKRYSCIEVAHWTTEQFVTFRGYQYGWGLKTSGEGLSLRSIIRRLFMVNIILSSLMAFLLLTRENSTPALALASIGIPDFPGRNLLGEILWTFSFGIFLVSGCESISCHFGLLCYLIHWFKNFIPIPDLILTLFDANQFQPLYDSLYNSTSLALLWGKNWHQLFRRNFLMCGGYPVSTIVRTLGGGMKSQKVCGLFGTFFVSGLLHEYVAHTIAQFPSSFLYFLVQPIGIIIEPFIIPYIPKILGGGRLWVLTFTLLTARSFGKAYVDNYRLLDDGFKPLKQWSYWSILFPSLSLKYFDL